MLGSCHKAIQIKWLIVLVFAACRCPCDTLAKEADILNNIYDVCIRVYFIYFQVFKGNVETLNYPLKMWVKCSSFS